MPSPRSKSKATPEQLAARRKRQVQPTLQIPADFHARKHPKWGSLFDCPESLARGIWKAMLDAPAAMELSVPALPKTLNSMKIGRRKHKLHPDVEVFRAMVRMRMECYPGQKDQWSQVLSSKHVLIVVLESPKWITADLNVAKRDADNRLKVVLDALQLAAGAGEADDSNAWSVHVFKLQSWEDRTTVGAIQLPPEFPWVRADGSVSKVGQASLFPTDRPSSSPKRG